VAAGPARFEKRRQPPGLRLNVSVIAEFNPNHVLEVRGDAKHGDTGRIRPPAAESLEFVEKDLPQMAMPAVRGLIQKSDDPAHNCLT